MWKQIILAFMDNLYKIDGLDDWITKAIVKQSAWFSIVYAKI